MRIAIIGGGVAGLSAAVCLSKRDDVVVYEKESYAGGHACTIDVPVDASGTKHVPVDIGFQFYHEEMNPNVAALFGALDVPTEPLEFSMSACVGDDAWTNNGHRTRFGDSIQGEIARFMKDLPALASLGFAGSLKQHLDANGYSQDFKQKCLAPLLSFWWVSRTGLFDVPAAVAAGLLEKYVSLTAPTMWRTVAGGCREYVRRLTADLSAEILLETPVRSIRREPDKVIVHDAKGGSRPYDHVVLATDALTALRLLEEPTPDEKKNLGMVRLEASTLVVHRDESVMPRDRALHSYGNYRATRAGAAPDVLRGELTYYRARPGEPPVFVTVAAPGSRVTEDKIVAKKTWSHMVVDPKIATRTMRAIQGKHRAWFCGGHTVGLPIHEHSLCSGLAVAEALGAAYPFSADPAANAAFQTYKMLAV